MAGQKPEAGGGSGGSDSVDTGQSGARERSDHAGREFREPDREHRYLDAIGLKRLRLQIEQGDAEVGARMFEALDHAYMLREVDSSPELIAAATKYLVDTRDMVPQDEPVRDAEYTMMAMNAMVNRQADYAAISLFIPLYDAIKVVAWGVKDFGTAFGGIDGLLGGSGLFDVMTSLPEYLLRTQKENPTTRPGLGGIRALGGLIGGRGVDRDLTWKSPLPPHRLPPQSLK